MITSKFTDSFFAFPIRIYDKESMEGFMKVQELISQNAEPDWIVGIMKVPAQWFVDDMVSWLDGYSRGRSLADVNNEGFDITQVDVEGDIYTCVWERRKFEDKLNEFMERYSNGIMKQIKEQEVGDE